MPTSPTVTAKVFILGSALTALAACSHGTGSSFVPSGSPQAVNASQSLPAAHPTPVPGEMRVTVMLADKPQLHTYPIAIVFDASGNGKTPEASPADWDAYSFAIQIAKDGNMEYARPVQYVRNTNPAIPPAILPILTTPNQFQFARAGNGLQVSFDRAIFDIKGVTVDPKWRFNVFVDDVQAQSSATIESMAGRCLNCFASPVLPVNEKFDITVYAKPAPSVPASARLVGVTFENGVKFPNNP